MSSSAKRKRALVYHHLRKLPIYRKAPDGTELRAANGDPIVDRYVGVYTVPLGGERASSIPDQIAKAQRFIDYAFREGRLYAGDTLLIRGGGVAGTAAAWHAVERGVNTAIQDKRSRPFSTQASCNTRWLHPSEYRWPTGNYTRKDFPGVATRAVPPFLGWSADYPYVIAARWRQSFAHWLALGPQYGRATVKWIEKEFPVWPSDAERDAELTEVAEKGKYDAILYCAGAKEKCSDQTSSFRSFPFWSNDVYGVRNHRLPEGETDLNVLVSGGGDGALQDFIRLVCPQEDSQTRPTYALGVLQRLHPALARSGPFRGFLQRLRALKNANRPKPEVLYTLIKTFLDEISPLAEGFGIRAALDLLIDPAIREGRKKIEINAEEDRLPDTFALNVFLARLLAWRVAELSGQPVFALEKRSFAEARSAQAGHVCEWKPRQCVLRPHVVKFKRRTDSPADPPSAFGKPPYEIVVLRHGVEAIFLSEAERKRMERRRARRNR